MAELILVRHAQAAFGTDDYDRLTELGHQQARWLGEYFEERGMSFDRVVTGTLRRHRETFEGIASAGARVVSAREDARLDEYDPERLLSAHLAALRDDRTGLPLGEPADEAATRKQHFRLLRDALTGWTLGRVDASLHRPYTEFQEAAYAAFEQSRSEPGPADRVLVVSSGGPISSIVAHHLEMPASSFIALNLQVRNSGFCEFRYGSRRAQLVSFNNVPHLDTLQRRQYITFS